MTDQKVIFNKKDIRQLTYLVIFGILIILFQVSQFLNTKKLNESYYQIINNRNKLIVSVNSILLESAILQRSIINLSTSENPQDIPGMTTKINASVDEIERNIAVIKSDTIVSNEKVFYFFEKLKNDYLAYKNNFQNFLKIANEDEKLYNSTKRIELRGSLETLQKSEKEFLELLVKVENIEISDISEKTNKTGWVLLIAGNAILLVILIFLVYILITERKQAV